MKALNIFLTVLIAALIAGGTAFFVASNTGDTITQVKVGGGSDNQLPYVANNGVARFTEVKKFTTATSTLCVLRAPTNATSTLEWASIRFDVASTSATIVDIAKASTAFATTTAIGTANTIAAGAQSYIVASTSPAGGVATTFAPGQFLVFGVRQGVAGADAAGTGFVPQGNCEGTFKTTI